MPLVTGALLWAHMVRKEVKKVKEWGGGDYFKHLTHIALNITEEVASYIFGVFPNWFHVPIFERI
jgi:hypothetical protein